MNRVTIIQELVVTFRDARNWRQFHTPKNLAQAISVEAGELNDLYLWDRQPNIGKVQEEMADILIFLLSMADVLQIDLAGAVINKIAENDKKYPAEKVSGNARKYTEL